MLFSYVCTCTNGNSTPTLTTCYALITPVPAVISSRSCCDCAEISESEVALVQAAAASALYTTDAELGSTFEGPKTENIVFSRRRKQAFHCPLLPNWSKIYLITLVKWLGLSRILTLTRHQHVAHRLYLTYRVWNAIKRLSSTYLFEWAGTLSRHTYHPSLFKSLNFGGAWLVEMSQR